MSSSSTVWILLGVGAALLVALLLLSPSEPTVSTPGVDQPVASTSTGTESVTRGAPVVDVGPDRTVGERETVRLNGRATVPGGGAATYSWTAEGGLGFFENARSPTTAYTAPSACDCMESVILTLTVTDARGVRASDSLILSVRDPLNCPEERYEACGSFVTPIDPCRYVGAAAACPAQPSAPCASPCITVVPAYEGCPEPPVPCPCVGDGCGSGWTSNWPFGPQPEHPRDRAKPRIDRQYPASIREGGAVPIVGHVDNPACLSVCFTWTVSKGWMEGANTLQPIYHAPATDRRDGETATITLTVYGGSGGRSYDQIRIRIANTDP